MIYLLRWAGPPFPLSCLYTVPSLNYKGQDSKVRSFWQEVLPLVGKGALTCVSCWDYQSSLPPWKLLSMTVPVRRCHIFSVTACIHSVASVFQVTTFLIFSFLSSSFANFLSPKFAIFSKSHLQLCTVIVKLLYFHCAKLEKTFVTVSYLSLSAKSSFIYFLHL